MVPLIPALSILLNICLMLKLSYLTWVRFSIWLLMGEWGPGWDRGQEEGKEDRKGWNLYLRLMPCLLPCLGLAVYFGYGIQHSKENQRELPGPNSTHYVVFPRGSLEETVQAVQPPSQAPAQDPGHME